MADNSSNDTPNNYSGIFTILAILILAATVFLAVSGVYFSFINPSF